MKHIKLFEQFSEREYDRSRGSDFIQGILALGKRLGIDPNYRW